MISPREIFLVPSLGICAIYSFHCFTEQCRVWYLDDSTFIGTRCLYELLSHFTESGPSFGLHINLAKCELYWPSGDCFFSNLHPAIKPENSGFELLGSPIWGPAQVYESFCLFSLI